MPPIDLEYSEHVRERFGLGWMLTHILWMGPVGILFLLIAAACVYRMSRLKRPAPPWLTSLIILLPLFIASAYAFIRLTQVPTIAGIDEDWGKMMLITDARFFLLVAFVATLLSSGFALLRERRERTNGSVAQGEAAAG